MKVHIRWMIHRDLEEIFDIENRSFDYPWSEDVFSRELRQKNVLGMVAEAHERVVGYMVYELRKDRLLLLNIAVNYEHRMMGVGRQMIEKLIGRLSSQRRTTVAVPVREANLDAQLFFRAMGFECVGVESEFYDECDEQAYHFEYRLHNETAVLNIAD